MVLGADELPPSLSKVAYRRVILPRNKFDRITKSFVSPALVDVYGKLVMSLFRSVKPKVFVTSHHWGIAGELTDLYKSMKVDCGCKTILGWRDIPDSAAQVELWVKEKMLWETLRNDIDVVAVFGRRDLFDLGNEYGFPPDLKNKLTYMGYVGPELRNRSKGEARSRTLTIAFGGGENRSVLTSDPLPQIIQAANLLNLSVRIVSGYYWDSSALEGLIGSTGDVATFFRYSSQEEYLSLVAESAIAVLAGGYNSVCEALLIGTPVAIFSAGRGASNLGEVEARVRAFSRSGLIESIVSGDVVTDVYNRLRNLLERDAPSFEAKGTETFSALIKDLL
jgi:predicted glycosyltransferase